MTGKMLFRCKNILYIFDVNIYLNCELESWMRVYVENICKSIEKTVPLYREVFQQFVMHVYWNPHPYELLSNLFCNKDRLLHKLGSLYIHDSNNDMYKLMILMLGKHWSVVQINLWHATAVFSINIHVPSSQKR